MNLLFITNVSIKNVQSFGVLKKIYGQATAFKKLDYKVDLCFLYDKKYILQDMADCKLTVCDIIKNNNNLYFTLREKNVLGLLSKRARLEKYDVVYIRFVTFDMSTLLFLRSIKNGVKSVIIEIPTYPYANEKYFKKTKRDFFATLKLVKNYIVDIAVRMVLKRYVSFIVLTIPKKSLWGIPVVSIENGIDYQAIRERKKEINIDINKLVLFTATNIEDWQGLDRLVWGLSEYKRKRPDNVAIIIKIAGEGSAKSRLVDLVQKCGLENNVLFCGQITGKDLDDLYNEADIAVGSLGRHRYNTNLVSTLKTKEYCAKGIPFIYSNDEPTLTGKEKFALKLPADDSPINFSDILDFYRKIQKASTYSIIMKELAANRYDWIHQIKNIDRKIELLLKQND